MVVVVVGGRVVMMHVRMDFMWLRLTAGSVAVPWSTESRAGCCGAGGTLNKVIYLLFFSMGLTQHQ